MTKHIAMILGYHNARLSSMAVDSVLANPGVDVILVEPDARESEIGPLMTKYGSNKRVILLFLKDNKFCAWGMNQGIKEALRRKYANITLMNNDATIDKGYFDEVDRAFMDPNVGLFQPKTYFGFTDVIYSAGTGRNILGFPFLRGHGQIDTGKWDDAEDVDYASMVVATIRARVFEDIGILDDTYIQYYDDIDFSIRARRVGTHHWRVRYSPWAIARHHTISAVGQTNRRFWNFVVKCSERNILLLAWKNGFLTWQWVLADLIHILKACFQNPLRIFPTISGVLWFYSDWRRKHG